MEPPRRSALAEMASSYREQSLSLFRRLLRAARQWQGSTEEADYIRQEARQQFRARQSNSSSSSKEIAEALEEGENRLQIALHYGIAYPRLFHADQFAKVPYVEAPRLEQEGPEAVASGIKDPKMAARLTAAARRRRERIAQQQQQGGTAEGEGGGGSS